MDQRLQGRPEDRLRFRLRREDDRDDVARTGGLPRREEDQVRRRRRPRHRLPGGQRIASPNLSVRLDAQRVEQLRAAHRNAPDLNAGIRRAASSCGLASIPEARAGGEYHQNTMRIRREYEGNTKDIPMLPPSNWLATNPQQAGVSLSRRAAGNPSFGLFPEIGR